MGYAEQEDYWDELRGMAILQSRWADLPLIYLPQHGSNREFASPFSNTWGGPFTRNKIPVVIVLGEHTVGRPV